MVSSIILITAVRRAWLQAFQAGVEKGNASGLMCSCASPAGPRYACTGQPFLVPCIVRCEPSVRASHPGVPSLGWAALCIDNAESYGSGVFGTGTQGGAIPSCANKGPSSQTPSASRPVRCALLNATGQSRVTLSLR